MPANLTPQYHRAELAYRSATSPPEQLDALQWMLREIPKHKGTDRLQADLKAKIARLKTEIATRLSSTNRSTAKPLQRQGAGRVLLIGAPNTGKSQLLAALTRAKPLVAAYPFSTQAPLPGIMTMEDCPIQLVDMPPITADYIFPDAFDLVRSSDLIFWVIDLSSESWVEDSQAVLNRFLGSKTRLGRFTGPLSNEVGITSTQTLIVLNKIDLPSVQANIELLADFVKTEFDRVPVSGVRGDGLVALRHEAFQRLDIVRVYAKDPRQREADRKAPFFLKRGESLVEFARQIHGDLASKLKSARVWGRDAADCAIVKPDYQPCDQDVIELQTST